MILYVNDRGEVKAVGKTDKKSLTPVYVNENSKDFITQMFLSFSEAKMCCYKVSVNNGIVSEFTPYVDSDIIDTINNISNDIEAVTPYKASETVNARETEVTFVGVPDGISLTTVVKDLEGNFIEHNTTKSEDIVKVFFDPLTYAADITLSIN